MAKPYTDDALLMLSGVQHFLFCERQWALSYIEMQWVDNRLTVEGNWLHEHVDDPEYRTKRSSTITLRSVRLLSRSLGFYGLSDVVELRQCEAGPNAISHPDYPGHWQMHPVEYKRGKPKENRCDEVQLCAQAICLEEMYGVCIEQGELYYGETRHRHEVVFDEVLRHLVATLAERMHLLYEAGQTPRPIYKAHCKSCSLFDLCLPKSLVKAPKASSYNQQLWKDEP